MALPAHLADAETRELRRSGPVEVARVPAQPTSNGERAASALAPLAALGAGLRSVALSLKACGVALQTPTLGVRAALEPDAEALADIAERVAAEHVRLTAITRQLVAIATRGAR